MKNRISISTINTGVILENLKEEFRLYGVSLEGKNIVNNKHEIRYFDIIN